MISSVAAALFAAAITASPNDLVVMDAASRWRLAGIVVGTRGIVLAVRSGLDAVLAQWPTTTSTLRHVGGALLLYLAARRVVGWWTATSSADRGNPSPVARHVRRHAPTTARQPETWVLGATIGAAHAAVGDASLTTPIALTATVRMACLMVWASQDARRRRPWRAP